MCDNFIRSAFYKSMKNRYEGTLFGVQFISGIVFVISHTIHHTIQ